MKSVILLKVAVFCLTGVLSFAAADETRIISVNLTGSTGGYYYPVSSGSSLTDKIGYGPYAVEGRFWIDFLGIRREQCTQSEPRTAVSIDLKDDRGDMAPYTGTRLYLCSCGSTWCDTRTPVSHGNGRLFHAYMDDTHSGGNRSGLKLENLPFARYAVVLYFGGDAANTPIPAYQVNGNFYKSGPEGTLPATGPDDVWGDPCGVGVPDLSKNTLIVTNLTGTLTVKTANESPGRGRFAGFQIVGILPSDSRSVYTAEVADHVRWSDRQEGLSNESGVWSSGKSVILTNRCTEAKTLTFDEPFEATSLALAGSGTTILQREEGIEVSVAQYDLSGAGKTVFTYGTGAASVTAGRESIFTLPGNGTFLVPEGGGAVWSNMVWGTGDKVSNYGTIRIIGGTLEEPLVLTNGNSNSIGPYVLAPNTSFKSMSLTREGNKLYFVEGAGAETSTFILDSVHYWGMIPGTSIRNVKLRLDGSESDFWLEEVDALDDSVWIDLSMKDMVLAKGNDFTLGALSGSGNIRGSSPGNYRLTLSMAFGPTSYAGTWTDNVELIVGGGQELCFTGEGTTGTLSVNEGAVAACDIAPQKKLSLKNLKGNGTLIKRGAGTLRITEAPSSFTGTLSIGEGGVVMMQAASNLRTVLTRGAVSLELHKLGETSPVLDLVEIPQGSIDTIRLGLMLTEKDLISGRQYEAIRIPEGVSTNIFSVHVETPDGGQIPPSAYKLYFKERILSVGLLGKLWSGGDDANGVWNSIPSNLVWDGGSAPFNELDRVAFTEIPGKNPMVRISGSVGPESMWISSGSSVYTFIPGASGLLSLRGDLLAIGGEVRFAVPVRTGEESSIKVVEGAKVTFESLFGEGVEADSVEAVYTKPLSLSGGILTFAPGEGRVQQIQNPVISSGASMVVVSNGTLSAWSGGTQGTFGQARIRIDRGGVLNFEGLDISGYEISNSPIVINRGGTLHVKKRDTLYRGLTLNGGKLVISGREGREWNCALMPANTFTVNTDSEILGRPGGRDWDAGVDGSVDNPAIKLVRYPLTISIAEGAVLTQNVSYQGDQTLIQRGSGTLVQNGMPRENGASDPFPLTFTGGVTINPGATYELNCEHQNGNGELKVYSGACLCGSGSVTGPGRVVLGGMSPNKEGGNAKLCGSLTLCSLAFRQVPQGQIPMKVGEPWSPVSVKVTGTLTSAENGATRILINNGSFTVGSACDATGFASARIELTESGVLAVEAGGTLELENAPLFPEAGGSSLRIGLDTSMSGSGPGTLRILEEVDLSGVFFELDTGGERVKYGRYPLLTAPSIRGWEKLSDAGMPVEYGWTYSVGENQDGSQTLYAQTKTGFLLILR